MMNQLKLILMPVRGYSRRVILSKKVSWSKKTKARVQPDPIEELFKEEGGTESFFDRDFDDVDEYDPESLESTFEGISSIESVNRREAQIEMDKLKTKIAIRKCFNTKEPNFITWSERVQIQSLYDEDNEKWNLEMLSEAFPALPGTIKKILDSKRQPKTAEEVIKYDQNVIENWEKFKRGELSLDPRLVNHLNNFKGRQIQIIDLVSVAEKFVKSKPIFPTPKNDLFTKIVQKDMEKLETPKIPEEKQIPATFTPITTQNTQLNRPNNHRTSSNDERFTFDTFVKKKVNETAGNANPSLENKLLIDIYKQKLNDSTLVANFQPETGVSEKKPENSDLTSPKSTGIHVDIPDFDKDRMATGILEWKKKDEVDNEEYSRFIKIPRKNVDPGVTFRVKNRYYDSDGEFLYKVPGLDL